MDTSNFSFQSWAFTTQEECSQYFSNFSTSGTWCAPRWDHILCWPPTPANSHALLPCPPLKGVNPSGNQEYSVQKCSRNIQSISLFEDCVLVTEFASRVCSAEGLWNGKTPSDITEGGWTNYTKCFIPEIRDLMDKLYSMSNEDAKFKLEVAGVGRVLETVGLCVSLASILVSLVIFSSFRSLRNNRTRIHWHLFVAMKIQLVIRLTVYFDQYVTRERLDAWKGIDNTPMLCESFYVLLEYARTAMFLWMFIEGMYLHNMVTLTVFQDKPNYKIYYSLGWGLPILMTSIWASVMICKYTATQCWWGYNLSPYFWILEGPRLTVMFVNLLFLLNILRVLITKLQASVSSESRQIRKAVRAAIVLLPLLGTTNILGMLHSPVESNFIRFAAWTYFTTFLSAFQGFFVALIYCFLNNEVKGAIKKTWKNYRSRRCIQKHRRQSQASFHLYKEQSTKRSNQPQISSGIGAHDVEMAAV